MEFSKTKIIALAVVLSAASVAPGCKSLANMASDGKITTRDIAREKERRDREKKEIARLEQRVEKTLQDIEEMRKNGKFRSADYREKTLKERTLPKLKELDKDNAKLESAPQELEKIKSTYTEERYAKKALTQQCRQLAEGAKEARMEERWRTVGERLDAYVTCRRKLKDAGGDPAKIEDSDKLVLVEYDNYAEYLIENAKTYRQKGKFRYAVGMEKGLLNLLENYAEIKPGESKIKAYKIRMSKNQRKWRDPEEVKAERQKKAFEAWAENATKMFEKEWKQIQAAEAEARPDYKKGVAALEEGNYEEAEKHLLTARQKLFQAAYPSGLALETAVKTGSIRKGLSYEIAAALARAYFEQGEKSKLYPELSIIKDGRKWLDKEQELKVRLYDILSGDDLAPKPTDAVRRYAGRYSDTARELRGVKEVARAMRGEAYNMLGVAVETISTSQAAYKTDEKIGKIVKLEDTVDSTRGKYLVFDHMGSRTQYYNCRDTNKISRVHPYTGKISYEQKCKTRKVKTGYRVYVPRPDGMSVSKGTVVELYAPVSEKKGEHNIYLKNPGYVRVAPGGTTKWFLGTTVEN